MPLFFHILFFFTRAFSPLLLHKSLGERESASEGESDPACICALARDGAGRLRPPRHLMQVEHCAKHSADKRMPALAQAFNLFFVLKHVFGFRGHRICTTIKRSPFVALVRKRQRI